MLARDLMICDIAYVMPDADLADVARMLAERGVGAVPVVDDRLTPIGIVTRGSLAPKTGRLPPVDLGEIPSFLLRDRPRPPPRPDGRELRDVMSSPAIIAPDTAQIGEIARVMETHRIGYVPIVRDGRIVGLVDRARLRLGAEAVAAAPAAELRPPTAAESARAGVTAAQFRSLVAAHERQEELQRAEILRQSRALREQRVKELAARRLSDARWRDILQQARQAAASGFKECVLIRFPSRLCVDGGRAINAPDPNWPRTLRGEPADIFRRWREELEPQGFRLAAQIVEFPDGLPGDAALFLMWGG